MTYAGILCLHSEPICAFMFVKESEIVYYQDKQSDVASHLLYNFTVCYSLKNSFIEI